MQKTLVSAVSSLKTKKVLRNRNRRYQMLGSGVGAVGGYFGLPALLLELPVSTALMMRSIAEQFNWRRINLGQRTNCFLCILLG